MRRLGYDRYLGQGGDFGALVSLGLAAVDHQHVAGVHVNFLPTAPPGDPAELDQLTESELARVRRWSRYLRDQSGYMKLQSTRPQTLAYALTDSPVGQLAWIVERFKEWTDSNKAPEEAVDRDRLLTNASIYWLTGTAGSSAQPYYEAAEFLPTAPAPPRLPPLPVSVGVAVYPHDIVLPIRRLAERGFPNIVQWSEFDRGGHFAAMEQPELPAGALGSLSNVT
jgi:epoxide hydrolase